MRSEDEKYKVERQVVIDLATRENLELDESSMEKGDPDKGEPDVSCTVSGEAMYFEVTEACAPEFAEAIAEALRNENGVSAAWGGDGIEETLIKKLQKSYKVTEPVELVIYTDGRNALPDDVLVAKAEYIIDQRGLSPFRKIWLCSEGVFELGSTCS